MARPVAGGTEFVRVGKIVVDAETWAEVLAGIAENTIQAAKLDITHFRIHGLHYPYPQSSSISWQQAQVNWNNYGAANSALTVDQVFQNFVNSVNSSGG